VQPGDTVSGIAVRFGVSESALASQNKLNAGDAIYAGQQLVLPDSVGASPTPLTPGRQHTYVIQPGDTLSGIAAQFGVSENALAAQNGIQDPNRIVAGTTLTVPA
jgi:LysM repeat protein